MAARFEPNKAGIARLLQSEDVRAALIGRARAAQAYAVAIAPVRTGHYRASFRVTSGVRRGRTYARLINTAHYAIFLEYGTRYMRAQRILRRSIDAMRSR